jgi:hypothetical protein
MSQRKQRTMTFEQILAQARHVRTSLGTDDMPPTALVERMGRLKAIVHLPYDRERALEMIVRARTGFGASAMTICWARRCSSHRPGGLPALLLSPRGRWI